MDGKTCTKCDEHKPLSEFPRNRRSKDGRYSQCKPCTRLYYTENRDKIRELYCLGSKSWVTQTLSNIKRRAQSKGVPFDEQAVRELLEDPPEVCPVFGTPFVVGGRGRQGPNPCSPEVDQIRPGEGYVRGNVQIISSRANRIKSDASAEEVMAVAKFMSRL